MEMDYNVVEDYLLSIPKFASKTSHDNLKGFLAKLNNPQDIIPTIHIAGTNGKGSTCAFLASILREKGLHVGMFTSPHLIRMNERMKLDDEIISDEEMIMCFQKVKEVVDQGMKEGLVHPNFFEFIFMMATYWYYRKHTSGTAIDYVIYETGLGGRLDATNILQPELTIITSIGMDHMQYLGNTIAEIAGEKAGIIKRGIPCVYLDSQEEAGTVIRRYGEIQESLLVPVEKSQIIMQKCEEDRIDFLYQTRYDKACGELGNTYSIRRTALYQLENAALAIESAELLQIDRNTIMNGLAKMCWSGRMEEVIPGFYVDGAHNEPAIIAFCDTITTFYMGKKIILLFAVSSDKSYNEMIRILCNRIPCEEIIVTAIEGIRTTPVSRVAAIFEEYVECPVKQLPDLKEAYGYARDCVSEERRVYCVGSLYLVGSLLSFIKGI